MQVIPVIDFLNGQVVRGRGGRRNEYRPWNSPLANGSDQFADVALALVACAGDTGLYLADLDAIMASVRDESRGAREAVASTLASPANRQAMTASGARFVLIDSGLDAPPAVANWIQAFRPVSRLVHPVIGLESVADRALLPEMLAGCERFSPVFSLDLKAGSPLARCPGWLDAEPLTIVDGIVDIGFTSLIVLDLADVGESRGGSTHRLCAEIRRRHPHLELIAGGGVRSFDDALRLADSGCDYVLVATALHTGDLTPADCQRLAGIAP